MKDVCEGAFVGSVTRGWPAGTMPKRGPDAMAKFGEEYQWLFWTVYGRWREWNSIKVTNTLESRW